MDRITVQKTNKELKYLNNTADQLHRIDFYDTPPSNIAEHKFFSSVQETFYSTDHKLGYKMTSTNLKDLNHTDYVI